MFKRVNDKRREFAGDELVMEAGAHDGHDADDGEGDADDNYYEPLQAGGAETALAEEPTEERADVPGTPVPGTPVPGTPVPGTPVPGTPVAALNRRGSVQSSIGEPAAESSAPLPLPESPAPSAAFETPHGMTEEQKEELAALILQMQEVELQLLSQQYSKCEPVYKNTSLLNPSPGCHVCEAVC